MLILPLLSSTPNGAISGVVSYDTLASPSSSVRNARRRTAALSGMAVILKLASGETVATTTSGADGRYRFGDLPDGSYRVSISVTDAALPDGAFGIASSTLSVAISLGVVVSGKDFTLYPIKLTKYAVADGAWTNPAIWNSGSIPGFMDSVFANGKQVTISTTLSVDLLSNSSSSDSIDGGGTFTITGGTLAVDTLEHGTIQPLLANGNAAGYRSIRLWGNSYSKPASVAKGVNRNDTIIAYPILIDGYQLSTDSQVTQTDMESGMIRARRTRSIGFDHMSVSWLLTLDQFRVWRAWFRDDLAGGARWTMLKLCTGEEDTGIGCGSAPLRRVQFKSGGNPPFTATRESAAYWRVKAELLVLPEALNV